MCQIRVNLRRWACLLAALACLLALLPLPAHAAGAASKVVRVGWYEDAYNITGKNGERSGYAYEYEQSVAAYTGWTYEYVKAGWSDLLQMMKSGEIDLMAGVSYTEDRAQDMLFSELPMGREIYYLYADLAHTDISASDLRTLNGKRIALLKTSVQAAQFYQWEEDHGLHLQYVWSNSFEQGKQQAQDREIDCVISTETPAWVEYGMSAIAQTGGSDIYFAISRTRQDLKEELDHAMRKMEFDKPFYADELYQRYPSASYTPVLSSEEQDWVTQHGDIRIGFLTSDAGISTYVPESGQLVGVINDYITFASDSISNQKLDFSLVGYDSMEEEIQALKDGQIDLIFHFAQNPYVAEENNFVLSNTVLTLNMAAVTAQNSFNENHANTVALLKDDLLLKWYVSYYYPDWNIVEYNSLKDAEAAMRSGENDCLLAESGEVAKYREDKRLHSVFLTQDGNVSFAVARGDVTLMSILNKTLRTIPASMLTGALPMYEASLEKVTVTDFVKDNFLVVSVMLITFFGMILAVILVSLRRSRIAEANAKEAARQARKLNQKLQESQRELRAALQQAESASSAKTTFLSNVSHDIRTPMNAIVGLASLMENDLQNPRQLASAEPHQRDPGHEQDRKRQGHPEHPALPHGRADRTGGQRDPPAGRAAGPTVHRTGPRSAPRECGRRRHPPAAGTAQHPVQCGQVHRPWRQHLAECGGDPPQRPLCPLQVHRYRQRHRHERSVPEAHLRVLQPGREFGDQQGAGHRPGHGHHQEHRGHDGRCHHAAKPAGQGHPLRGGAGLQDLRRNGAGSTRRLPCPGAGQPVAARDALPLQRFRYEPFAEQPQ